MIAFREESLPFVALDLLSFDKRPLPSFNQTILRATGAFLCQHHNFPLFFVADIFLFSDHLAFLSGLFRFVMTTFDRHSPPYLKDNASSPAAMHPDQYFIQREQRLFLRRYRRPRALLSDA